MATRQRKKTTSKKTARVRGGAKKRCARCLKSKTLKEFGENHRMRLGRKSYCRACSRILQKAWNRQRRLEEKRSA